MRICASWLRACPAAVAAAAVALLPACSSTSNNEGSGHASGGFTERMLKPNQNKVSPYDKKFDTASLGDRGAMRVLGGKSYSTSKYAGNTDFKGLKNFQTKAFNQSGKTSREQTHSSPMGNKKDRASDQIFKTEDSRFSSKKSKENDLVFRRSTKQYQTSDYAPGKKSLEDNKRPYFKAGEKQDEAKTAYSEQEVKALLNRN